MGRINTTFKRLRWEKETALIPYVTVGHPSLEATRQIAPMMARQGADLIVLGVPSGDPLTGETTNGITLEDCLGVASDARRASEVPLILRCYYGSIQPYGHQAITDECAASGVDGLFVSDLPLEESGDLKAACESAGIDLILMLTPTATAEEISRVAEAASGFIYCLSPTPIADAQAEAGTQLTDFIAQLREHTTLPLVADFGIGTPEQVAQVSQIADGAFIDDSLRDLIKSLPEDELIFGVGEYVRDLKAATLREL